MTEALLRKTAEQHPCRAALLQSEWSRSAFCFQTLAPLAPKDRPLAAQRATDFAFLLRRKVANPPRHYQPGRKRFSIMKIQFKKIMVLVAFVAMAFSASAGAAETQQTSVNTEASA